MSSRFCTQCGAKLLPDARFCAECGRAIPGTAQAVAPRRRSFERWAPVVVIGAVVAVGAAAVLSGAYVSPPPNVPPPRQLAGNPQSMPEGHPPVEVPDEVRKVIAKLADAAKEHPEDVQAWQQLGFVQYRAAQVDPAFLADADATYAHVLEREPENLDALRARGNIAFDRNDPAKATEFYRSYLRLKPDDLSIQTDLGTMLLSTQQVDAAVKAYKDVLAVDPKFFQAQFNLAIAYRAAGDDAQALTAMEHARDIAGDDATRKRVDELLARLKGEPAPAEEGGGEPSGGLRADVEQVFRSHPIVGPKIDRIEWPSDDRVRVVLRDFPMDGMPPMVRDKFSERIRTGLRDSAARAQVAPPTVELVDAASGRVMDTIASSAPGGAPAAALQNVPDGGAAAPPPAAPPAAGPGGGDLHADIEAVFRGHPIVAPKLDRIEWLSADHGRVVLHEFPMEAMPPMVRDKFTDRIRTGIRDGKAHAQTTGTITIELVDAATGQVMQTITE